MRLFVLIALLMYSKICFGQLQSFNLTVDKTNETCTANGSLQFTTSNTTSNATLVYTIYLLPDLTTPVAVLNEDKFSGLVAGTYRVIATQSLGNESNSQQRDVTIENKIALLSYQLTSANELCGKDGIIKVTTKTGIADKYEIIEGPVLKPKQTSNEFTGLKAGKYKVRVFDICGEGVVQEYTLLKSGTNLQYTNSVSEVGTITCSSIRLQGQLYPVLRNEDVVVYPVKIDINTSISNGKKADNTQIILSGNNSLYFNQDLPFYTNETYTMDVTITDGCGKKFVKQFTYKYSNNFRLYVEYISETVCADPVRTLGLNSYNFIYPINVTFLQFPLGFDPIVFNSQHPGGFNVGNIKYSKLDESVPLGEYQVKITDACGQTATQSIQIVEILPNKSTLSVNSGVGCEPNTGMISISKTKNVIFTSVPDNYTQKAPFDASAYIDKTTNKLLLGELTEGTYSFTAVDICDKSYNYTINIPVYKENTDVQIIENCGSFDVDLKFTSNGSSWNLILQKFNSNTGEWDYINYLKNNTINYNFAHTGDFRILKTYESCEKSIFEFTVGNQPKIKDVYSFLCKNATYDVFVDAVGLAPLTYRITEKDGQPFVVENGNSSVFIGLPAATYNFQATDKCGNILNSKFEVPKPFDFRITSVSLCEGSPGSITLPNFPVMEYSWWKGDDSTKILSTTNSLSFPSFNLTTDGGIYHARVKYTGNPNSCIDFVLDYTISEETIKPNAGQDINVSYCGNQGVIDLISLLKDNNNNSGIWTEVTTSGKLNSNLWDSSTVPFGEYIFKYQINDLCANSDESTIKINLFEIPKPLITNQTKDICSNQTLELQVPLIQGATYTWSGPNDYISNDQNLIIPNFTKNQSGNYEVYYTVNGCQSDKSIFEVSVNDVPEFNFELYCDNNIKYLKPIILDPLQDQNLDYSWTVPSQETSKNKILKLEIGEIGNYYLTVKNEKGCEFSKELDIDDTMCSIQSALTPNHDGKNDNFDLTGLGGVKLWVYSRWGRLVYENNEYIDQWYGQNMHGELLPEHVYYYIIQLNSKEERIGWVHVFR